MRRIFSFMLGGLSGAIFGAAIALLLAPSSGDELRVLLRERADSVRQDVQAAAAARRNDLEKQLAQLRAPRKPDV